MMLASTLEVIGSNNYLLSWDEGYRSPMIAAVIILL
jgi:hypothetical protein